MVILSNSFENIAIKWLQLKQPNISDLPTLKPEQLPDLMQSLNQTSIKIVTRCLLEWQLHTMCRPGEAAGTRWEEIDLDKNLWIIPIERMKTKRAHTVPLSPQVINLLKVIQPLTGHREYVFPSDKNPKMPANSQTANMALKRMGYGGRLVAHGLRALASTTLNEQAFDADVIEAALAHVDKNSIRGAYNRTEYLDRRKIMMAWWSEYIESAAVGNLSLSGSLKYLRVVN